MRTDCGSEIAVLLRTRIISQDPWTDVDWKFQDLHIDVLYVPVYVKFYINDVGLL